VCTSFGGYSFEGSPVQRFHDHATRLVAQLRLCPTVAKAETEARNVTPVERAIIDTRSLCSTAADTDLAYFARQLAADIDQSNTRLGKL
jgi:hypothetical protein